MLGTWLALEPVVRDADHKRGILESLDSLGNELNAIGETAVIGFAAYLLGSVLEALIAGGRAFLAARTHLSIRPRAEDRLSNDGAHRLSEFVATQITGLGLPLWDETRITIFADDFVSGRRRLFDGLDALIELNDLELDGVDSTEADLYSSRRAAYRVKLTERVRQDFALMRRRLIGKEPELFAEIDRLEAEAELREAIGPALIVLTAVVAARVRLDLALLTAALGLVIVAVLQWQGQRRREDAGDALVDALIIGRVGAPVLERLEYELGTAIERAKRWGTSDDDPAPSRGEHGTSSVD